MEPRPRASPSLAHWTNIGTNGTNAVVKKPHGAPLAAVVVADLCQLVLFIERWVVVVADDLSKGGLMSGDD